MFLSLTPKSRVVLPFISTSFCCGSLHSLHAPTFRLYRFLSSSIRHGKVCSHGCVSLRFGHPSPPYAGAARTWRVRCRNPVPHIPLQCDHDEKSDTTQSRGHGIRHACSPGGRGEKNSQIRSDTDVPFNTRTQRTDRL